MDATYNYKDYSTKASFNAGSVIGWKADGVVGTGGSGTATINYPAVCGEFRIAPLNIPNNSRKEHSKNRDYFITIAKFAGLKKKSMKRVLFDLLFMLFAASYSCGAQVRHYDIKVEKSFPHDTKAYTQGLFFHDGTLYESTGQYGQSSLRTVDLKTGRPMENLPFKRKYFVEGSVILGDNLYVLTWTNKVLFIYDARTLEYKKTYSYPRDGWGLTTDGKSLIASDGSSKLYFLSEDLKLQRTLNVTLNGKAVRYLNELEWIDGRIWANVYTADFIVIINPQSGAVEGLVNCEGLLPHNLRTEDTDVLNGIAVDEKGRIYLTGKNWPRLYQISLVEEKE